MAADDQRGGVTNCAPLTSREGFLCQRRSSNRFQAAFITSIPGRIASCRRLLVDGVETVQPIMVRRAKGKKAGRNDVTRR